jgi:radical SAM superfamily enzyme YgiQ (UPF0313 family)
VSKINRRLIVKAEGLISKEKGTIFKDHGGKISICLVYPNTYHVGMSNLGFQGIYSMLNARTDIVCERAFLPDEEDTEEYIRTATPVFSLESKTPLEKFQIVAFSISFENDYPNIYKILQLSNIPLFSSDRNKYHPLLIAGGACMCFNPEPVAPIFDLIFIGEAEESLIEFLDVFNHYDISEAQGNDLKSGIKKSSMNIRGVYVPAFYEIQYNTNGTIFGRGSLYNAPVAIESRYIKNLNHSKISHAILTPETEFADKNLLEIMRGCVWNCRFCMVGHVFNPPRMKNKEIIKTDIQRVRKSSKSIGLIGPSLSDYPGIEDILSMGDVDFSITSLRAGAKSNTVIEFMRGHKSISIAPEAGSERLRYVINKKISEAEILETSSIILDSGVETLKLYFMIGLPTETSEDIMAIIELAKKIRALTQKGNILLSISIFVPKPFTPFQWHRMDTADSLKKKLRYIKKTLHSYHGMKVFYDLPKYALMQGLFSMGDRRMVRVLKFIAETENWQKAAVAAGVNPDYYLFRKKNLDEILPWDFIESKVSKKVLWDEYVAAINAERL